MKKQMKRALAAVGVFLASAVQFAQAAPLGTAFNYQGKLTDGGTPANGSYDLRFILYDAEAGGNQIGPMLTNSAVAVTNGLFTTTLDFGAGVFTGEARWLEIAARTNGGGGGAFSLLSPRQPLTPAPCAFYASYAATANRASAVDAGAISNASLAPNAVTSDKIADGAITPADLGPAVASNTFWRLGGNAGTTPGTQYLGTSDTQPLELKVGGVRALRLEPTASHAVNVVAGWAGNRIASGVAGATIGGGGAQSYMTILDYTNRVEADFATISGGRGNAILSGSTHAAIGGGYFNIIRSSSPYAAIAGGMGGCIEENADEGTIGGGSNNRIQANAVSATIAGGYGNTIEPEARLSGIAAGIYNCVGTNARVGTIGGGEGNKLLANASYATIAGGLQNAAYVFAAVGGGYTNKALGAHSSIGGGRFNQTGRDSATIGGGENNEANGYASAVGGGFGNRASDAYTTVAGGRSNTASWFYGSVAGGCDNVASGIAATIGGGSNQLASGWFATVAGGVRNSALGDYSVIGGGNFNRTEGEGTTVAGGVANCATNRYATVAGGSQNTVAGYGAFIGGGHGNQANNVYATIPGGFRCTASGIASFAAGWRAHAIHDGSFVLADGNNNDLYSDNTHQFTGRFTGGVRFWSSLDAGVHLLPGATSWSVLCDRNLKEHLQPVDTQEVLRRLVALPLHTWNLTTQDPAIRHLGPTAQDFAAAFGLGETNTCINTVDADGVALAAIQGLNQKLEEKNAALEKQVAELTALVKTLMEKVNGGGQ